MDHGVNFGGSLNLFGGYTEELRRRIENALDSQTVWSLDIDMPDYARMLEGRKDFVDHHLLGDLREWQSRATTLRSTDLGLEWLAVGDSHTSSVSPHNSMIVKENGRTLFGQVSTDFAYVRETLDRCPQIRGVTMSFGSIDVRHHICRLNADWKHLYREWKKFGDSLEIEVEYSIPFPVEFEGRKLPKTGWYKDRPFWGSWEQRSMLVREIWEFAEDIGMNVVEYPKEWLDIDPEEYAKTHMEKPQSVHLSPEKYRRKEWGQSTN